MMPIYFVFFGCLALVSSFVTNQYSKFNLAPEIDIIDREIQQEVRLRKMRYYEKI